MKWFLFLFVVIGIPACRTKKNRVTAQPPVAIDSTIARSVSQTYSEPDSVYWERNGTGVMQSRKDFRAIKPVRIFISDSVASSYDKMMAAYVDTAKVISYHAPFTEEITHTDDAQQNPVTTQYIYRYGSYKVKVIEKETDDERTVKLFVNGKELKPGKDIDTSESWSGFSEDIHFDPSSFSVIRIPGKEYLYLRGELYKCNGIGCGFSYHLLYDPVIGKAVIVEQFRIQKFLIGYDNKSKSPVFMVMEDSELAPPGYAIDHEGRAFIFSRSGKVLPATGSNGKQYYVKGYGWDTYFDTIYVVEGHLPSGN